MREAFVIATRREEAEGVLVQHDDKRVVVTLDNGDRLEFDRRELLAALDSEEAA